MGNKRLIRFDWAMKHILRNKANFDVLEGFLSSLLKEDIHIEDILESESNQDNEKEKFNRVDLKCRDSSGMLILIEVQNQREIDYLQRILWGSSKAVVESQEIGKGFSDVCKVISVSIMYHKMRMDERENTDFIYHGATEILGMHTGKPLVLHGKRAGELVSLRSREIFPEYYMIYAEKFDDDIREAIDEWVYFFKHGSIREDFKSPGILLAAKKLAYIGMEDKQRKAYDSYLEYISYELSVLDTAKIEGREEGEKIGIEKGLQEGIEKGLQQGIEKGLQQGKAEGEILGKLEIVRNMLLDGIPMAQVIKYSGLSEAEVMEMAESIKSGG